jgi:hypothetical protein
MNETWIKGLCYVISYSVICSISLAQPSLYIHLLVLYQYSSSRFFYLWFPSFILYYFSLSVFKDTFSESWLLFRFLCYYLYLVLQFSLFLLSCYFLIPTYFHSSKTGIRVYITSIYTRICICISLCYSSVPLLHI